MKHNLPYIFMTLALFSASFSAFSQFEGTVTYDIEYSSSDAAISGYLESFPKRSTLILKDDMMRFDQNILGGGTQSYISNAADTSTTFIMNVMGNAFQVNLSPREMLQLEQTEKFKIIHDQSETITVAGYPCKLAYALSGTDSLKIYYTDAIKSQNIVPQFEDLTGFPLIYEIEKGKVKMKFTCSHISNTAVEASQFEVPSHVREIPFDDFARTFALRKE